MESNVQKIREALELCVNQMCANCRYAAHKFAPDAPCIYGCETLKIAKAALAEPLRNCDIGTKEEQSDRFENFCNSYERCSYCPVKSLWNFDSAHNPSCEVLWLQMPYKEGGAK